MSTDPSVFVCRMPSLVSTSRLEEMLGSACVRKGLLWVTRLVQARSGDILTPESRDEAGLVGRDDGGWMSTGITTQTFLAEHRVVVSASQPSIGDSIAALTSENRTTGGQFALQWASAFCQWRQARREQRTVPISQVLRSVGASWSCSL